MSTASIPSRLRASSTPPSPNSSIARSRSSSMRTASPRIAISRMRSSSIPPPQPIPTAVSAPGKVLLAGGYLVLNRTHTGLVFALDARIHVLVQPMKLAEGSLVREITVKSPQFEDAVWRYAYKEADLARGEGITELKGAKFPEKHRNPFIETALEYALAYISTFKQPFVIKPSVITILADNDYYSHPEITERKSHMHQGIRRFHDLNMEPASPQHRRFRNLYMPVWEAHKTGLGSSAALVTSFIGAVLSHYLSEDDFSLKTDKGKQRLHNLAQAAHSAAQGKVGSGFDVASAVFGSCIYRRFSAPLLQSLAQPGEPEFSFDLRSLVDNALPNAHWDEEIVKDAVSIPKGLRLVMCDVDCGSQTPGMVKRVLEWRLKNMDEATRIWNGLQDKTDALAAELVRLDSDTNPSYSTLSRLIGEIRALVREMSKEAKVPIEPPAQTALLNACSKLPGVIGGVVPGAGGYDAIALLIEDKDEVATRLGKFLESFTVEDLAEESHDYGISEGKVGTVRLLGVRGEMEGARAEDVEDYGPWIGSASRPASHHGGSRPGSRPSSGVFDYHHLTTRRDSNDFNTPSVTSSSGFEPTSHPASSIAT